MLMALTSLGSSHLCIYCLIHLFFRIINSSPVAHYIRCVSWLEQMNSFIPSLPTRYERYIWEIKFFFLLLLFIEYDNLIMTLSRVCFLYVTDVLEGTSAIDWLKITIGSLEQVAGKRERERENQWLCCQHFLSCAVLSGIYTRRETYLCQRSV